MLRLFLALFLFASSASAQITNAEFAARRTRAMEKLKDGILLVQASNDLSLFAPGSSSVPTSSTSPDSPIPPPRYSPSTVPATSRGFSFRTNSLASPPSPPHNKSRPRRRVPASSTSLTGTTSLLTSIADSKTTLSSTPPNTTGPAPKPSLLHSLKRTTPTNFSPTPSRLVGLARRSNPPKLNSTNFALSSAPPRLPSLAA